MKLLLTHAQKKLFELLFTMVCISFLFGYYFLTNKYM